MSAIDINPYRSPQQEPREGASAGDGVWSFGNNLLVHRRSYAFPDRCLLCNAPADGRTYGLRLSWLPDGAKSIAAAFHLAGPLAYVLVMILFTRWAKLYVPFCRRHLWRRRRSLLFGWLSFPVAFVLIGICVERRFFHEWMILLIGLVGVAGTLYGYFTYASPKAVRIERQFVLIAKVAPEFVAGMPPAPVGSAE